MRLAYLVFAQNSAYCNVLESPPPGVTVDLNNGTWRCETYSKIDRPIGVKRYVGHRAGIIGVYDLDNLDQVNSMVRDAVEVQRHASSFD